MFYVFVSELVLMFGYFVLVHHCIGVCVCVCERAAGLWPASFGSERTKNKRVSHVATPVMQLACHSVGGRRKGKERERYLREPGSCLCGALTFKCCKEENASPTLARIN